MYKISISTYSLFCIAKQRKRWYNFPIKRQNTISNQFMGGVQCPLGE